jgi:hypothetical protein
MVSIACFAALAFKRARMLRLNPVRARLRHNLWRNNVSHIVWDAPGTGWTKTIDAVAAYS